MRDWDFADRQEPTTRGIPGNEGRMGFGSLFATKKGRRLLAKGSGAPAGAMTLAFGVGSCPPDRAVDYAACERIAMKPSIGAWRLLAKNNPITARSSFR